MKTKLVSLLLILAFMLTIIPCTVAAEDENTQQLSETPENVQQQTEEPETAENGIQNDVTDAGNTAEQGDGAAEGNDNNTGSSTETDNGSESGTDAENKDPGAPNENAGSDNNQGSDTQPDTGDGTDDNVSEPPESGNGSSSDNGSGDDPQDKDNTDSEPDGDNQNSTDKDPENKDPENKDPEDKDPENKEPEDKDPDRLAESLLNLRMSDGLSKNIVEIKESNLGDFIADAYYYYFSFSNNCDAAFVRGTEICADVVGDWRLGASEGILPNGRAVSLLSVTGQQIIDALEAGALKTTGEIEKQENRNPDFLQVAGLKYKINTGIESSVSEGKYRVSEIQVFKDGVFTAIDREAKYNVAVAHTAGAPGTEYPAFAGAEVIAAAEITDAQILTYYITHFAASEIAAMSEEEAPRKTVPCLSSQSSPLAGLKPGYPVNYEGQDGAGRIQIVYEPVTDGECQHSVTDTVNKKEATCTEKGYTGDVVCTACGEVIVPGLEIPLADHVYARDSGIYTWGADDASCILTATCDICREQKNVSCFVATNIIRQATNIAPGSKEVKASITVNGKIYENSKVVTIPVREDLAGQQLQAHLTHVYTKDSGVFSWNADNTSCILTATCDECGLQTQIACVITTKVTKAETSVTAGSKTVTAKAIVNGKLYQQMKTVIVPAKNSGMNTMPDFSGTGYAGYGISGGSVATGDTGNAALYVFLIVLAVTGLGITASVRKQMYK